MATNFIKLWMHMTIRLRKMKMVFPSGNDLHMNELFALGSIYRAVKSSGGSISNAEIQDELQITKSAVSQMLDTLEEKGYIERKPDASDRRRMCVTTTPRGEQILQRMGQHAKRITDEVVARIGEEKIQQMFDLLNEFTDVFIEVQKEQASENQAEEDGAAAAADQEPETR